MLDHRPHEEIALRPSHAFALLATLAFFSCSKSGSTDSKIRYPNANVILITLDTTRVDHLSCYGYSRKTSPNLDKLAAECVKFTNAFSNSSFTPQSHASILTSRYPSSHGLLWWDTRLPISVPTLGESMQQAGRKTAMFSPLGMGKGNALGRGFDRIVENDDFGYKLPIQGLSDYPIPPGNLINEKATLWLDAIGASPFFTWVHYYDAHRPYAIYTEDRPFCQDPKDRFGDDTSNDYQLSPETRKKRGIGAAQAKALVDRYDSGLLDLDKKLGVFLDMLRKSGRLEKSILVITADHGEAFTEYDSEWFSHDPFLFDEVTHVPLLIRFPDARYAGKNVDALAESIDIMPTILDYVGLVPPKLVQGFSLRPAIEDDKSINDYVASERQGKWREKDEKGTKAGGPTKYVELPPEQVGSRASLRWKQDRIVVERPSGAMKRYATVAGKPQSEKPIEPETAAGKGQAANYQHFVHRVEAVRPETDLKGLSPEEIERLKQLGYID